MPVAAAPAFIEHMIADINFTFRPVAPCFIAIAVMAVVLRYPAFTVVAATPPQVAPRLPDGGACIIISECGAGIVNTPCIRIVIAPMVLIKWFITVVVSLTIPQLLITATAAESASTKKILFHLPGGDPAMLIRPVAITGSAAPGVGNQRQNLRVQPASKQS